MIPAPISAGLLFITTAEVMPLALPGEDPQPAIHGLNLRNDITHGSSRELHGYAEFVLLVLCVGVLGALRSNEPVLGLASEHLGSSGGGSVG